MNQKPLPESAGYDDKPASLLIVVDTETTGLPPNPDVRPLQVGAVAFDMRTGAEISEFNVLLRPDVWAKGYRNAQKIHGISRLMAETNGVGMCAGYEKFGGWLRNLTENRPWRGGSHFLSAWNSGFDRWVLARWRAASYSWVADKAELAPWEAFSVGGYNAPNGCLQAAYRAWAKDMPNIRTPRYGSLSKALSQFNLPNQSKKHDAVEDARLAGLVWWSIESTFRKEMAEKQDNKGVSQ